MDLLPYLNFIPKFTDWVLRKFGKKIVDIDEYKDTDYDVDNRFPEKDSRCIQEKAEGATFRWDYQYPNENWEKYFQINGSERRYFKFGKNYLWIKRPAKV